MVLPRSSTNILIDIPGVRLIDSPNIKGTYKIIPIIFLLIATA